APEETAKSIRRPPSREEGIMVSKSQIVRFPRVVDLSQAIGPDTQMFPAYPPPTFTQWTTRQVHGFFAESLFLISDTATHVDATYPARHALLAANVPVIECVANLPALGSCAFLLWALRLHLRGTSG